MQLPKLYQEKYRYIIMVAVALFYALCYTITNRFHLFEITYIEENSIDALFSFYPQWIWIYSSAYVFVFICYFFSSLPERKNRFIWSFIFTTVMANTIFLFFPTAMHRLNYDISSLTGLTKLSFEILRTLDLESNCLPSLHVATGFLGAMLLYSDKKVYFVIAMTQAILIALSTMFVKQHLFYDVMGGTILAFTSHFIFFWGYQRK
jgi:membrane-associated phospholipid phosphatase